MRVLFLNRPSITTLHGGDVVQMHETRAELERLGVSVDVSTELRPDLTGYDLVHLFNLETPATTLIQAQHVHQSGRPMVLSTIYWDLGDEVRFQSFFEYGRWPAVKKIFGRGLSRKIFLAMYTPARRQQQRILDVVDGILPNSQLESDHLAGLFSLRPTLKRHVVVNGVRASDWPAGNADRFKKKYMVDDFVFEVGRIGFIKNQLSLLQALRETDYPVVLAGQITDQRYLKLCQREAGNRRVLFLPTLGRQELADAYAAARVHALPSYKETVGLVSLEAGLYGCRLVSTTNGGGREYLQDDAEYCQPHDLNSIRQAVIRAWERPENPELIERIREHYTWSSAAKQTLNAYEAVLKSRTT